MVTVGLKIGDGVLNPTLGKPMYLLHPKSDIWVPGVFDAPASGVACKEMRFVQKRQRSMQLSASKGYSTRAEEQPIAHCCEI